MIVAVDPGYTVGLAAYCPGSLEWTQVDVRPWCNEGSPVVLRTLTDWLADKWPSVVVIEAFVGSGPRDRPAVVTIRLIGVVEGWAARAGVPCVLQVPQRRLAFRDQARELIPGYKVRTGHARAALAHALAYSHRTGKRH